MILRRTTLAVLGINVYGSLGDYARNRTLSVQGVESPNFREYWRVRIVVEALLQRGPGASEPPDETVERLASLVAVALAKALETAAANGLSAESEARLHKILDRHWKAFQRGLCGDPPARV